MNVGIDIASTYIMNALKDAIFKNEIGKTTANMYMMSFFCMADNSFLTALLGSLMQSSDAWLNSLILQV